VHGVAGFLIGVGQALAGEPSRYGHAGIITSPDGAVVEAEPGGAREGHLSDYADEPLLICDGPIQQALAVKRQSLRQLATSSPAMALLAPSVEDVETDLRRRVVAQAVSMIGTPYSAMDYLALAAWHLHLPSAWLRERVANTGRVICSQLVDLCYEKVGIHLFDDGRLPGDVMPADLAGWADDYQQRARLAAIIRHPAGKALR